MLGFTIERAQRYILATKQGEKCSLANFGLDPIKLTAEQLTNTKDYVNEVNLLWAVLRNHAYGQSEDLNHLIPTIKKVSIADLRGKGIDKEQLSLLGSPLWHLGHQNSENSASIDLLNHFAASLKTSDLLEQPEKEDYNLIELLFKKIFFKKVNTFVVEIVINRMLADDQPSKLFSRFRPQLEPLVTKLKQNQPTSLADRSLLVQAVQIKHEDFTCDLKAINELEIKKLQELRSPAFLCAELLGEVSAEQLREFPKFLLPLIHSDVPDEDIVDFICSKIISLDLGTDFESNFGASLLAIQKKIWVEIELDEYEKDLITASMLFIYFDLTFQLWESGAPVSDLNFHIELALVLSETYEEYCIQPELILCHLAKMQLKTSGEEEVKLEAAMFKDIKSKEEFNAVIEKQVSAHPKIIEMRETNKIKKLETQLATLVTQVEALRISKEHLDENFKALQLQFLELALRTPGQVTPLYSAGASSYYGQVRTLSSSSNPTVRENYDSRNPKGKSPKF